LQNNLFELLELLRIELHRSYTPHRSIVIIYTKNILNAG